MYMTYALEERFLRPFAEAGVELFSFDTCCGFHPYGLTSTTWPEPHKVDFTECDAHATRVLSACADTIEHYARIVKEESQGDWLCGTFYGYVVQFHEPRIITAGHLAIDRLTRSRDLDYLFSPALYSHRSLKPGGYSTFMSLVDTYHLHGKLWYNENDLRTFRVLDVPNVKADRVLRADRSSASEVAVVIDPDAF